MLRQFITLVLALVIFQASSAEVFASDKRSQKVKVASHKTKLRKSYEHELRMQEDLDSFEFKPRRKGHFKMSGRQFLFWLPLLITASAICPTAAQQADAYVDCDDSGGCFNPADVVVPHAEHGSSAGALLRCAPFVNPNKLVENTQHRVAAVLGYYTQTPAVKSIARPGFLCANLTNEEKDSVIIRFRDLIAPKVASFVSLARASGRKAGILFGVVQEKCASLYQQIEMLKLAEVLNITQIPTGFKHYELHKVTQSAKFYANLTDHKTQPAYSLNINMAALTHAVALNRTLRSLYTNEDQSDQNTQFVIRLQEFAKLYNHIQWLYQSSNPQDHQRAHLLRQLYEGLREEKTKCPDFFANERDLAHGLSQVSEDFVALLDGSVLAPLYKLMKSDTHWFLIVRPTRDLGGHVQGTLKGMGGRLVTKKCEEEYDAFVGAHNETNLRSFPCAIHPVLPMDLMMK